MQTLSVAENGISYLALCLSYYSEGCAYFVLYAMALMYIWIRGSIEEKKVFIPGAGMLCITVFNPIFPLVLDKLFDVNKEYYRFFWIAPVVILVSYVLAKISGNLRGVASAVCVLLFTTIIIFSGNYLYKNGYIAVQNIYKMPTEIPEIAEMIHNDSEGRFDGDYYPRAAFEYDYEMCLRQYDASIMLVADREAYLNAVMGNLDQKTIMEDENYFNRVLAVVALNNQIAPSEFKKGLEKTATEYVCVSTINEPLCNYLEDSCKLKLVGQTANHSLYYYELKESEGFRLPDYSDVWENY